MKIHFNSSNLAQQNIIHIYYSVFSNDKQVLQYMFRAAWAVECVLHEPTVAIYCWGFSAEDEG